MSVVSSGLAVVAIVVVAAAAASLELPDTPPPATVEVADGLVTAPNPLSEAQMAQLRDQADPGRLRCEPRDCELWRFDREGGTMADGVVELGDGLVLAMIGAKPGARPPIAGEADDEEETEAPPGHRLVAIDPATGQERWNRPVGDYPTISGAYRWVRLLEGPDGGALIVSGTTVTAIDADGDQRWVATPAVSSGPVREVWDVAATDDVVLFSGTLLNRSSTNHHLTAVDATSGAVRWTADVGHVAALQPEQAIVVDPDGTVRALDAATGRQQWSRTGSVTSARLVGPWLATQGEGRLHLIDPETGDERGSADLWLTSPLVRADDLWVGTGRAADPDADTSVWSDETGSMQVVAFDLEAALVWTEPLGHIRPWWDCCPVRVDGTEGIVSVETPSRTLYLDLATGGIVDAEPAGGEADGDVQPGLDDTSIEGSELGIAVAVRDDGRRIDVTSPAGAVTVRSEHRIRVESLDPLVVADDREIIGVRTPSEP